MNHIHHLSSEHSVLHNYMAQLRDIEVQHDRAKFRQNVRNIGRIIGFELSKGLTYQRREIQTPLAAHQQSVLEDEVVVITILRAGLPLHDGILDVFPDAENGFISAYRKHHEAGFDIEVEYVACPDLNGKTVILNDPMLATGGSFVTAWEALLRFGTPKRMVLAAVIASEEGVTYIQDHAPHEFELWVGAIDPELNAQKYIVPGLGDAGDLAFGPKVQQ